MYSDKFLHPRIAGQYSLVLAVDAILQEVYQKRLEFTTFGKPSRDTFDYAAEVVKQQAVERGVEIGNHWMIGDNPKGDILGANQCGWKTILV